MNSRKTSCKEKQSIADAFIASTNPYKKGESLKFDLHAYDRYLKEHDLHGKDVPDDVMQKFVK